jgi:glycosyltransferase involved in cell wall biosynthesis
MGISLGIFKNIKEIKWNEDKTPKQKIVYLGTLLGTRKLDFLIRVFAIVNETIPDTELYMVGPEELPDDRKILQEESAKYNVSDKVILTGRLPRDEALAYVKNADVCVSPFFPTPILNSTSPTKLIEYMALHKPVVANDHPEQSLVIQESGGGLCTPYKEEDFANAIIKILLDPEMAKEMGSMGYQYATKYRTYTYLSKIVEDKYRELCEN